MTSYSRTRWLAVVVFAAVTPTSVIAQDPNREVLTNRAVIEMIVGKVPKALILTKIQTTTSAFDLSAAGLVNLHQAKVEKDIIKAMLAVSDTAPQTAAPEILTNQSVILMVEGRLPKDLILHKIKTTRNSFDLTATGLVKLNQSKVPEDIIKVMMQPSDPSAETARKEQPKPSLFPTRAEKPAAPVLKHVLRATPAVKSIPTVPGIYLYYATDAGLKFEKIEPTGYSSTRTDGSIVSSITKGISTTKQKVVVRGNQAAIQTSDPNVEFYFVFEKKTASASSGTSGLGDLTNPNEFSLVRFDTKANEREVVVAQSNASGYQSGTEDRANVPFTFDRLAAGIYRVAPTDQLSAGQYAFVTSADLSATGNRLFDFGVNKPAKLPDH